MASEKNFQSTVTNAVHEIVHGSFCMTVGNFYDLLSTGSDYDKYELLKAIKNDLFDIYLNLGDILSEDGIDSEKRDKYKQKCYGYRNMLVDMNLRISAIRAHIKKKTFLFRHYSALSDPGLKDIVLDPKRVNDDLSAIIKSLSQMSDESRINIMSGLMACLPLRIARGLYFDYISKNLSETFSYLSESEIDSYIEFFEIFFNPDKINTGRFIFEEIAEALRRLDVYEEYFNPEASFSDDIRDKYESEYLDLYDELDKITYQISVLFETVNYLLIMLSFAIDFAYLTDDNFVIKDLYYLVKEARENSTFAFDGEIFSDKIENETIKALDSIEASSSRLEKELSKTKTGGKTKNNENHENEDKFLTMYSFAYQLLFEALYDIDTIIYKSVKPDLDQDAVRYAFITKDLAKVKINQLTETIKASSPDASVRNRKLERQFFLEYVPCHFNVQEFHNYIINSFSGSSQIEILSAISNIHNSLDAYGMGRINYDNDYSEDHDDCDCGDHHHHHH